MKARYSGQESEAFWDRINAIPGSVGRRLYALGCDLQDLEGEVLALLGEAEDGKTKKKVLKKRLKKLRDVKRR